MDYLVPETERGLARVWYRGSTRLQQITGQFKKYKVIDRVSGTPFQQFFAEPVEQFSGALIHQLLVRRVKSRSDDVITLRLGETICTFGAREFAAVTGLRFESPVVNIKWKGTDRILSSYFPGAGKKVKYSVTEEAFMKCSEPEDVFKLGLCCLVEGVLLGLGKDKSVNIDILKHVDDLDYFFSQPWGETVWKRTAISLNKDVLNVMRKHVPTKKTPYPNYGLEGYAPALQYWAYKVIPELGAQFANNPGTRFPKLLTAEAVIKVLDAVNLKVLPNFLQRFEVNNSPPPCASAASSEGVSMPPVPPFKKVSTLTPVNSVPRPPTQSQQGNETEGTAPGLVDVSGINKRLDDIQNKQEGMELKIDQLTTLVKSIGKLVKTIIVDHNTGSPTKPSPEKAETLKNRAPGKLTPRKTESRKKPSPKKAVAHKNCARNKLITDSVKLREKASRKHQPPKKATPDPVKLTQSPIAKNMGVLLDVVDKKGKKRLSKILLSKAMPLQQVKTADTVDVPLKCEPPAKRRRKPTNWDEFTNPDMKAIHQQRPLSPFDPLKEREAGALTALIKLTKELA